MSNFIKIKIIHKDSGTIFVDNETRVCFKRHYLNGESKAKLYAIPRSGFSFKCWEDNTKSNPREISLPKTEPCTAIFEPIASYNEKPGTNRYKSIKPCFWSWFIPVFALAFFVFLFFVPSICEGQTSCRMPWGNIISSKYNNVVIPINAIDTTYKKSDKTIHSVHVKDYIYLHKFIMDTTYYDSKDTSNSECNGMRVELVYRNSIWYKYLYWIVVAVLLFFIIIVVLKKLVPYWEKIADMKYKQNEKIINQNQKYIEEQLEYERREESIRLSLYEKIGKMRADEIIHDNENNRRMMIMEQEQTEAMINLVCNLYDAYFAQNKNGQFSEQQFNDFNAQVLQILSNLTLN